MSLQTSPQGALAKTGAYMDEVPGFIPRIGRLPGQSTPGGYRNG